MIANKKYQISKWTWLFSSNSMESLVASGSIAFHLAVSPVSEVLLNFHIAALMLSGAL